MTKLKHFRGGMKDQVIRKLTDLSTLVFLGIAINMVNSMSDLSQTYKSTLIFIYLMIVTGWLIGYCACIYFVNNDLMKHYDGNKIQHIDDKDHPNNS